MRGAATAKRGAATAMHVASAGLALVLFLGCATASVDVAFDPVHDFSPYRTWSWLSEERSVDALPGEERRLHALASHLVHHELQARGLARVDRDADLLVGYGLRVQRSVVTTNETGAHNLLSSYHASPSYLIQASAVRVDVYDHGTLAIVVRDRRRGEQVVWRGELSARRRDSFAHYLPEAVARLLQELPVEIAAPRQPEDRAPARAEDPPGEGRAVIP